MQKKKDEEEIANESDIIHKDNLNPYKKIHVNMNNVNIKDKNELKISKLNQKYLMKAMLKIKNEEQNKNKTNNENKKIKVKETKEIKEIKENKQNIKVIKNNRDIVDNNIKLYSNKDIKIPKPEMKKNMIYLELIIDTKKYIIKIILEIQLAISK